MRGRLLVVIVAGFLIGAIAGAAVLALTGNCSGPTVATSGKALIGGPFTLIDQNGKTVTDQDFRGRFMLVFFGFTHCPDICPAELQVMSQSLDALGPKAEEVVPIFITLDPERDTPAVMGDYVKNFGSRFVGLTGSPEADRRGGEGLSHRLFEIPGRPGDEQLQHRPLGARLFDGQGRRICHPFRLWHACRQNDGNASPLPLAARPIRPRDMLSLHCNIESPFDSAMQHFAVSSDGRDDPCCTISMSSTGLP